MALRFRYAVLPFLTGLAFGNLPVVMSSEQCDNDGDEMSLLQTTVQSLKQEDGLVASTGLGLKKAATPAPEEAAARTNDGALAADLAEGAATPTSEEKMAANLTDGAATPTPDEAATPEEAATTSSGVATTAEIGTVVGVFLVLFLAGSVGLPAARKVAVQANTSGDRGAHIKVFATYSAEFWGTFVLVFTVGCCNAVGNGNWNALAIASVLMVMIYSTASTSGANLNPAVSLALWAADKADMTITKMVAYWAAQILGGISAGYAYRSLFEESQYSSVEPGEGFKLWHAGFVEVIYTFMLCFVVLNCATVESKNNNHYYGHAIGFVIVAGGYAAGGISTACFNPAVALGLGVSGFGAGHAAVWALFELVGAILAALIFKAVRVSDSLGVRCLSEFLGTFFLVFTVGLNLIMDSPATALSAGMALMCMIYALGDVSGAHFNPAVSLACYLRGATSLIDLAAYIVTQLIAGASAGALYAVFHMAAASKDRSFGLAASRMTHAGVAELFATAVLAYVVLCTATAANKGNHYFGFAIGSCVVAGGFALGAVSGGELNPAVSVGIAVGNAVHSGTTAVPSGANCILLCFFELIGGIIAASVFHMTHAKEFVKVDA